MIIAEKKLNFDIKNDNVLLQLTHKIYIIITDAFEKKLLSMTFFSLLISILK
jgi:hypothetical protein